MTEFTEKIIWYIQNIPRGKVLTYGGVAALAGNPGAARQVSWVLRSYTEKLSLPWFRVINSTGGISIKNIQGYTLQKTLLEKDGIVFNEKEKVDLKAYMWDGTPSSP